MQIKYRIKFTITDMDASSKRDQSIDLLFSEIENLESDYPINIGSIGEIINISNTEYKILNIFKKFQIEDGIMFNILTISISNYNLSKNSNKPENKLEEYLKKYISSIEYKTKYGNSR